MPLTAQQLQAWSRQEAAAAQQVTTATQASIWLTLWAAFTGWYSRPQVSDLAARSVRILQPARQQTGGLGAAYVREVLAGLDAVREKAPAINLPAARLGADLEQVYSRPAEAYRLTYALTEDTAAATTAAQERLFTLVRDDLTVARRDGEMLQMRASGVTHYRRIVHPELSATGVCGLCLAAADRLYSVAELLPIHDRCKCTVAPDSDTADEAVSIDLDQLYEDAGGTDGAALKRVRYQVNEHGELGPVLGVEGQKFQRQGDAPKGDPIARARRELAALEPVLDSLESRAAAGEDVAGPLAYQRDRVAKLRAITA
ncbi:hypothetical protein [Nocardioides bruguierae]|uniref:Uncharacterized protein n=1 Tax=Nocardioides bruguierae TaxID=2945102 RepID=A0A9X2DBV6_9ACTN|nr:hypothetical protein [Nocardioides bruguierae]MCM0622502.1 hypothetical protein [Nocardioides bruguierae]